MTAQIIETIKPCPFCGEEATAKECDNAGYISFTVECPTEHCFCNMVYVSFGRRSEAIDAWNRRAMK